MGRSGGGAGRWGGDSSFCIQSSSQVSPVTYRIWAPVLQRLHMWLGITTTYVHYLTFLPFLNGSRPWLTLVDQQYIEIPLRRSVELNRQAFGVHNEAQSTTQPLFCQSAVLIEDLPERMLSSLPPVTPEERVANVFVFGDQADDARSLLRALLRLKPDPILQYFLSTSYGCIRTEILREPVHAQNHGFTNLMELLDIIVEGPQRVALDHAITSICHFGLFFEKCRQSQGNYPEAHLTQYVGICTGSLAAAAVSCCRSAMELLPVAVQVCALTYRVGAYAAENCVRYDSAAIQDRCWAVAVPDLTEQDASQVISRFIETKVSSKLKSCGIKSTIAD